ncbi:type II secretion system protein GspL [Thiolapillus sp.]
MAVNYSSLARLRSWRQHLLACLPAALAGRIASGVTPYILEIQGERAGLYRDGKKLGEILLGSTVVDPAVAALLKPHEHPLTVMLPVDWMLGRTISLPAAAQENLRQVIGFELDRFTPFSAEQVYFDFQLNARGESEDMLSVEVALVPRKRVDDWLSALRAAGIAVDSLSAASLWDDANLLPPELRPRLNLKRLARRLAPVALVIVLLGAAMALPLWQKREMAISLQSREAALRGKASEVMELRERVDKEIKALEKIRDQWQALPPVLDVLQVLTSLLPDNTSLQRMEVKGDTLTINGTSSSASSLIGLLQNSPGFENPHFLSPVTQQRGKEVFNLSARINMPFPRDLTSSAATSGGEQEAAAAAPAAGTAAPPVAEQQGEGKAVVPEPAVVPAGDANAPVSAQQPAIPAPMPVVDYKADVEQSAPRPSPSAMPPQRIISGAGG